MRISRFLWLLSNDRAEKIEEHPLSAFDRSWIWVDPLLVEKSDGKVQRGSSFFSVTGQVMTLGLLNDYGVPLYEARKRCQFDRSHKPLGEVNRVSVVQEICMLRLTRRGLETGFMHRASPRPTDDRGWETELWNVLRPRLIAKAPDNEYSPMPKATASILDST